MWIKSQSAVKNAVLRERIKREREKMEQCFTIWGRIWYNYLEKEEVFIMVNKTLMDFLCSKTAWEDLGNEKLLHELPEFGMEVGAAINEDRLIDFTKELSAQLEKMDLYKASLLSNFIGFACEKKEDTSAGEGMIKLFIRSCEKVYQMFQDLDEDEENELLDDVESLYNKNEDGARAYYGFNILCISTMAFLTRDAALRARLQKTDIWDQVEYLCEETPETSYFASIGYVNLMHNTCSDTKLLVLFPEEKKGFFATANDLNNCFHLLFLLEEQIYQKLGAKYGMEEFSASDSLVRLAHGEYPENCWGNSYSTYFMECDYSTARHNQLEQDDMMSLIWGEMSPMDIPEVDDRAVIVLWRSGINRSFDAQFLAVPHPALRPYVEIERELTDVEYEAWIKKIRG